ncbi:MAG TPA: hypothetical protein VIM86_00490 [Thermodesulfobacteriota bacterium]
MRAWTEPAGAPTIETMKRLIGYAVLAPSTHNTQPWRFAIDGPVVRILPDTSRRLPVVDPEDRELFISLGCALENLVLAARHEGYEPTVDLFPPDEPDGCLRVRLTPARPVPSPLVDAIARRQTNRRDYDGRPIPKADLARLAAVPCEPGVFVHVRSDPAAFETVVDLVREADRRQLDDEAFRNELAAWIRFNAADATFRGDGLAAGSLGVPEAPRWVGEWGLKFVLTGVRQAVKDERLVRSSSALALLTTATDDRCAWVAAGRTFERFALTATTLGVQLAHLNAPCEVPGLRADVTRRLEVEGHAQLLLRLGYAPPLPRAPRRPVDAVLIR